MATEIPEFGTKVEEVPEFGTIVDDIPAPELSTELATDVATVEDTPEFGTPVVEAVAEFGTPVEPTEDRGIVDVIGDTAKGAVGAFADVGFATLEGVSAGVAKATGDYDFAKSVSDYRNFAEDFYTGDVSDEVKGSFSYKATQAIGGIPAYAAAAATPVGWAALLANGYQQGRDDFLNTSGVTTSNATDEQLAEANKVGAMTAVPMMLLEKFGAGKLVNSVFKNGGKLTAKEVAKRVASSSLSEGATEGLQTAMQNTIASRLAAFDPDREITQDVLESMALGAIASGGMSTAGNVTAMSVDKLQGGIAQGDVNPVEMDSKLGQDLMRTAVEADSIPEVGSSEASKPSGASGTKAAIDNFIRPISSHFKAISPALQREVRGLEQRIGMSTNAKMDKVEPFIRGLDRMDKLSKADHARISKALFNGEGSDSAGFEALLNKYELTNDFKAVNDEIAKIRSEATDMGIDVGLVENYYPRGVKNLKKLQESYGSQVPSDVFDRLVHEREKVTGKKLTDQERQLLYEGFAKKTMGRGIGATNPNNLQKRTTDNITDDRLQFYERPEISLPRYIENMVNSIETKRLLGATEIDGERVAGRLGQVIDEEIAKGNITGEDAITIQNLVEARFGRKPKQMGFIRGAKNAGYLATMGNFGSAITQLGDFAFSAYQNGLMPTGKAVFAPKDITLHDIGIDPNMVTIEANDGGHLNKAVNTVFKATGLTALDRLAKNTNINASWNVMQKQAKLNPKNPKRKKLVERLQRLQGNDAVQTMVDLKQGKKSELVLEVLYHQIADVAPISMSEMPPQYAKSPNGRILYQLKSYTIKQLDFLRQESFSKIASGNKKEAIEGFRNLMAFATVAMAANASADVIKDIIFNREFDLDETVWDNFLRMFGMNRYAVNNAGRKGVGSFLIDLIKPAQFKIGDDISRDLMDMPRIEDSRSAKYFPFVGKLYDRWMGRGAKMEASYK